MKNLSPYAKAGAGFLAAGLIAYLGASDGGVTTQEWLQIVGAALAGSGLVYVVPNAAPKGRHERGAVDLGTVLVLAVLVVLVLFIAGAFR